MSAAAYGAAAGPRARAEAAQLEASDPAVSAFVAASAGSGKTKLLTDRLLRLMLGGAAPEKIQCLTFTKAAAAEMALRLQGVLAEWVRLDDAALDVSLGKLGFAPDAALRDTARNLFARVLDLPGGMRIGTIHAFCQSVLRRFPLEAEISPHFQLVDDRDTTEALEAATEVILPRARRATAGAGAVERLAAVIPAARFAQMIAALHAQRPKLENALALSSERQAELIRRALEVTAHDEAALLAVAVSWPAERALRDAAHVLANAGSEKVQEKAGDLLAWLGLDAPDRVATWEDWRGTFLLDSGKARGMGALINPKLVTARPDIAAAMSAEQERIAAIEAARRDLCAAEMSEALLTLAGPVLAEHAGGKARAGLLDYDDLIGRTERLLGHPGAGWVLYKLDGGLDHLLLDEVQDTAPAQWRIAGALTEEFFAGAGARATQRTVFAVGDRKQSIYSFQGADPDAFDDWRARLRDRVQRADSAWRDVTLDVSFRSTEPVLGLVDAVFENPAAADGVLAPGELLKHFSDRAGAAGRVELLPLVTGDDDAPMEPWAVSRENRSQVSARQKLAEGLAEWIRREVSGSTMLESAGRPLTPGDVLVLVRGRRNGFSDLLTRALKGRGVPVGGLDRIVLTEQAAVQDMVALGDALLLPEDNLVLAALLVSPLGGLSHESLETLAVGRGGSLRQALRARADERTEWRAAEDFFGALLSRVDYVSPYVLFTEALGALGGRARLFARLGAEAEEPLVEFLQTALAYTRLHPPSLQGFLHWLRRSGAEVKREQEEAGGAVRIMTVHGAKGLQAPLVILPDTTGLPPADDALFWADEDGIALPVFLPNVNFRGAAGETLRGAAEARRAQEYNRQLYVALTRAQDRLVVAGWQGKRELTDGCWYRLIADGFARLPVERAAFDLWDGDIVSLASRQRDEPGKPRHVPLPAVAALPDWVGAAPAWQARPPPVEPAPPVPLAPSRPEGVELGSVPAAASPLAERLPAESRFQRGKLVHALLQHLPALAPDMRRAAAASWLGRAGHGLSTDQATALADEVMAILDHPELGDLFGPSSQAEVPLTGVVANKVVGGLVDRLVVLPGRVLIADYKTNRDPPGRAEDTPVLYLRQMAAYRAVLENIFPDREVGCVLIWTRTAHPVMLSPDLLDAHAPKA